MRKLISFQIKADKGLLKKPDINDGMYLTYNMLHKPAILGILGAIIGLEGYQKNGELPAYYQKLKDVPVGVRPLDDEKGNFQKTIITYNNTTGFASAEAGGNLMVTEQTLVKPSYEIFLLLDITIEEQNILYNNIKKQEACYLPYLGKNDYSIWWNKDDVKEYNWEKLENSSSSVTLDTIFDKHNESVEGMQEEDEIFSDDFFAMLNCIEHQPFMYFERLPIGFDNKLFQYTYNDYAYTNVKLSAKALRNIYCLDNEKYIQLN